MLMLMLMLLLLLMVCVTVCWQLFRVCSQVGDHHYQAQGQTEAKMASPKHYCSIN